MDETIQKAVKLARDVFDGIEDGHPHPIGNYVSGSSLVKYPAVEIASRMLADRGVPGFEKNDVPGYFAYLGNSLGDSTLRHVKSRELVLEFDIGDGWIIRIHPDGMKEVDGKVFVYEHKFHGTLTVEKAEAATRQATLALAIGAYRHETEGEVTYRPASWAKGVEPFTWKKEWTYGGTVTCIAQATPPGYVVGREATEGVLAKWLRFYVDKARYIRDAVVAKDVEIARQWDRSVDGLTEFTRQGERVLAPSETITGQLEEYKKVSDQIKLLEEKKKTLAAEVMRAMRDKGDDVLVFGGYEAKLVSRKNPPRADVEAIKAAGLTIFLKEGGSSEYVRVQRKN